MQLYILSTVFLVLLGSFEPYSVIGALPAGWRACKRFDSNRDQCLKESIQHAVVSVAKKGLKKYGIFPADPLHFKQILIDQSSGPVNVKLNFSNLDIYGLKNIQVDRVSWKGNDMSLNVTVPSLIVYGDYAINGRVLVLPIVGQGKSNITIDQATISSKWLIPENVNGREKMFSVEKLGLQVHGRKVGFHFTNLFNGDKRLGDNMNKFLNENWELIWEEVQGSIETSFGQAVREISNRLFTKIPSNEVSPV